MMNLIFIWLLSFAHARPDFAHFSPGDYTLSSGEMSQCGQGAFRLTQNSTVLELGPLHVYLLEPPAGSLSSDAPGDEGCTYDYKIEPTTEAEETRLTLSEVETCKGKEQHRLSEVSHLQDSTVTLNVKQTGADAFSYDCVWKKSAKASRSR